MSTVRCISSHTPIYTRSNDPSITVRRYAQKFGSGNITQAFEEFETNHQCNDFCRYFGLDPSTDDDEESEGDEKRNGNDNGELKLNQGSNTKLLYADD